MYQGVWVAGQDAAAERETWRRVTAKVTSSEVTYNNAG
jgi:hypothetical protein